MPLPGLDGPCTDALWDAHHPNIFLVQSGAQLSVFALEPSTLDGPGALPQMSKMPGLSMPAVAATYSALP